MSEAKPKSSIGRILVALDASPSCLTTLEAAIELASRLEAELEGIYIEDINLLRLAELPFAREVRQFSASLRVLDSPQVEGQLRAHAHWVQRLLGQLAGRSHVRYSFRTVRGMVPDELLLAATDADLLILGRAGWSARRHVGSTARTMVREAPCQTLILQPGARLRTHLLIAYDGSPVSQRTLEIAALLWGEGVSFSVLILTDDLQKAQSLQAHVQEWLGQQSIQVVFHWLIGINAAALARLARLQGCGTLILPVGSEWLPDDLLLELFEESQCAILLVR